MFQAEQCSKIGMHHLSSRIRQHAIRVPSYLLFCGLWMKGALSRSTENSISTGLDKLAIFPVSGSKLAQWTSPERAKAHLHKNASTPSHSFRQTFGCKKSTTPSTDLPSLIWLRHPSRSKLARSLGDFLAVEQKKVLSLVLAWKRK